MADRQTLISKATQGLKLRQELINNPTLELCQEVMKLAEEIKTIGLQLQHDHGLLLGEELAIRSTFQKMIIEEDAEMSERVYNRIIAAMKKANYLGDQDLMLRLMQTRADYYQLIGDIISEIETLERSNLIKKSPVRTTRLIKCYGEYIGILNQIKPKEEEEKMIADKNLEANVKCMCELSYLRNENGFDYSSYIKSIHALAFRVYVFVGVMLSNPFLNELESNEQKIAKESFELAIEVAQICANTEYLCAAWGQKVGAYYGRSDPHDREEWVKHLKFLKERYQPKGEWIDDTLREIEKAEHIRLTNSDIGVSEPLNQNK